MVSPLYDTKLYLGYFCFKKLTVWSNFLSSLTVKALGIHLIYKRDITIILYLQNRFRRVKHNYIIMINLKFSAINDDLSSEETYFTINLSFSLAILGTKVAQF